MRLMHTRSAAGRDVAKLAALAQERRSGKEEQTMSEAGESWDDYCRGCVGEAREYATKNGTSVEVAMFRILSEFVLGALARFPDIDVSAAINELVWFAVIAERDASQGR